MSQRRTDWTAQLCHLYYNAVMQIDKACAPFHSSARETAGEAGDHFDRDTVPANGGRAGHVITVPVCRQQPNRHENLTVSTKGQCQTKPLVVSGWEGRLLNRLGPVPLHYAQPSFPVTLCFFLTSQLSGRTFHVCFSFTRRELFSAATHAYCQMTHLGIFNSLNDAFI